MDEEIKGVKFTSIRLRRLLEEHRSSYNELPAMDCPCQHSATATIIVAATQSMGMSYNTHLPWPKLKRENSYFEAITRDAPRTGTKNAVIMGYNTWDDEPTKRFSDRINVVITRNPDKVWPRLQGDSRREYLHVVTSLEAAVELLLETYAYSAISSDRYNNKPLPTLGRIFIIGGAELCREALQQPWVDRLLLTRVMADFRVDTFFPLVIDGRGNQQWVRQSDLNFKNWAGPEAPIGIQNENGVAWEAYMFRRPCIEGKSF